MMEKIGELNAWEAAIRAQSCSRHSGCMNTKYPHCLSNCLIQSKHNLLSTSLQLKCIYICTVNTLLGMRHCAGTWSSLSFTFLVSKYSIDFCSPSKEYPQILFSLVLKLVFTTWPQRDMVSISGNKDTGNSALYTSGETAHPLCRVSSRRLESKASHFILQ